MSKSNLFGVLRPIVYGMRDKNGNFRTIYIGQLKGLDPKSDGLVAVKMLVQLVFNTNYVSDITKEYLSDRNITAASIAEDLCEKGDSDLTTKDVANRLYREQQKMLKIVEPTELYDIVYNGKDPSRLISNISSVLSKMDKNKDNKYLAFDLDTSVISSECDSDIFDDFLDKIGPYTKKFIEYQCRQLPVVAVGYYNYLLHSPCLSENDIHNKDKLMQVLNYDPAECIGDEID